MKNIVIHNYLPKRKRVKDASFGTSSKMERVLADITAYRGYAVARLENGKYTARVNGNSVGEFASVSEAKKYLDAMLARDRAKDESRTQVYRGFTLYQNDTTSVVTIKGGLNNTPEFSFDTFGEAEVYIDRLFSGETVDRKRKGRDTLDADEPPSPRSYGGDLYNGRRAYAGQYLVQVFRESKIYPGGGGGSGTGKMWAYGFDNRSDAASYIRAAKAAGFYCNPIQTVG